jgi:hypothetical protein
MMNVLFANEFSHKLESPPQFRNSDISIFIEKSLSSFLKIHLLGKLESSNDKREKNQIRTLLDLFKDKDLEDFYRKN